MRAGVLLFVLLAGCSRYDDLALLELDRIEPAEVESGETLRVHGSGFALGRTPEVVVRGIVHRPGRAPAVIEAPLSGTVLSQSLIEIPVDDALIETVGGRATVDGAIWVGFRTNDDRRDIFSETRARIDFLPDTSAVLGVRATGARADEAGARRAESFGVRLSKEELGTVGVHVVSVDAGGLAARQGVRPGDTLIGLDGMTLYSWRDFWPDPSTPESTVYVERDGLRGAYALRWPHEVTERPLEPSSIILFFMLGFVLSWVSPIVLSARPRVAAVPISTTLVRGGLVLAFAALLVYVPQLRSATLGILALGTVASLSALVSRHRFDARSFVFALGGVLTIMMLAKTASLTTIVSAQTPSVLRWHALQTPASSLAFVAYLHAVALMSSRPGLATSSYVALAAVLGAAIFAGGWPLGVAFGGVMVLTAKSVTILFVARSFNLGTKTAAACSALGLGLASATMFTGGAWLYPHWSALMVGAAAGVAARMLVPPLRREAAPAVS